MVEGTRARYVEAHERIAEVRGVTQVVVTVMPKAGVLDPQGQAVAGALAQLGFAGVGEVRIGKRIELEIAGDDPAGQARGDVRRAAGERADRGLPRRGRRVTTVAIVRFPGSLDHDSARRAVERLGAGRRRGLARRPRAARRARGAVLLPGGFSYGDHLRCGAIASRAPIMAAVRRHAEAGGRVIGICNGFQVLCEAGLLPGALRRNATLSFVCRQMELEVADAGTPWTAGLPGRRDASRSRSRTTRAPGTATRPRRGWCCATARTTRSARPTGWPA